MGLSADFRDFLENRAALSAVHGGRVHQNRAPAGYDGAYVWFAKSGIDGEDALDESAGTEPFRSFYDLEVVSMNGDEVDSLADAVIGFRNHRGAFGNSSTVQAIFVTDHDDGYTPRGKGADQDLEWAVFQIEIVGYVPA